MEIRLHGRGGQGGVTCAKTLAAAYARLGRSVQSFGDYSGERSGAPVRAIPLDVLEATYENLGFLSNFAAAKEAFEQVKQREALLVKPVAAAQPAAVNGPVEAIVDHKLSVALPLKTGSWSSLRPSYVEKLAPCNAFCPAGNDVIAFVRAASAGREEEAESILRKTSALAAICGRVCPAPCMDGCNRSDLDGAVNIRGLERWIADRMKSKIDLPKAADPCFRIAIVGSGPAGLSAAYSLALAGHRATILEKENQLGGVLRTGIPAYRLARDVLDREIAAILELGVEARTGLSLDSEGFLGLAKDYDAVIIATGLQKLRPLFAKGAAKSKHVPGVLQGIEFLHRVNIAQDARVEGHVVVLGGGNTAMDCARAALRCGAERVTVAYRRTREEMPAIHEEIEEARHEGVVFSFQKQPLGFDGPGQVKAVLFADVVMGEADETGRRRPIVTEERSRLACDMVLLALGQSADLSVLPQKWELRSQRFFVHGQAQNVFVAGDLATGEGTVTHAIGNGRRVADLVLQALGVDCTPFCRPDRKLAVPSTDIRMDYFDRCEPKPELKEPTLTRAMDFTEVNHGLDSSLEAQRCFSCGHCTQCDSCLVYCPEGIIRRAGPGYEVDYSYCKGCGICVSECPRSAMEMHEL